MQYTGILWLFAALAPLFFLQRFLHHHIQAFFLILTRRSDLALTIYSILFFPGVLLHETSHYLTARLLGVQTGRISLVPRPIGEGKLQLGYVETAHADWLRDGLIGAAPLIAGGLVVGYIGAYRLNLPGLWQVVSQGTAGGIIAGLAAWVDQPDFWLWFYLAFAISSTMLPSASDRRAWLPLALVGGGLLALSLLAGAGPWLLENVAPVMNSLFLKAAGVFWISDFLLLLLLPPAFLAHKGLSALTQMDVE
jgi:hypothetical protein